MDSTLLKSLLDPAILFFFFGLFAGAVRSNLEIPPAIAKFFSLYLLMSIGFKGGVSVAKSGMTEAMGWALLAACLMALIVPAWSFLVLRRRLNPFDAAAIAATYGSVSAVTFITALNFLEHAGAAPSGHMSVALVIMESPAIIMAVLLASVVRAKSGSGAPAGVSIRKVLHEAFTDGAHLLLLGSLAIGFLTGEEGKRVLDPFTGQIQKGILAFFLLEMGLLVAIRSREFKGGSMFLATFGVVAPLINASIATALAWSLDLPMADAVLLAVLAASSSYIVVPAVLRYAIPEANAGLYFGMSLVITFPFNIIFGIPLYFVVVKWLWQS